MTEMELNEVQLDLNALRKLYGLLQEKGDCAKAKHTRNEMLDPRARALLKDLLDGATERLLQKYRKLIAAPEASAYNTPCSSQSRSDGPLAHSQSSSRPKAAAPSTMGNFFEGVNCGDFDYGNNSHSPNHAVFQKSVTEPSRPSTSPNKLETAKKQCQICKQNSMKHQSRVEDLTKEREQDRNLGMMRSGGTVMANRNWSGLRATIRDKLVENNSSACSSRRLASWFAELGSPPQLAVQTEDLRDFDHAAKQIEPDMSGLGSYSEFFHEGRSSEPSHGSFRIPSNANSTVHTERPEFVKKSGTSNLEECIFDEDDMLTHPVIKRADASGSVLYPNRRILQKQAGQSTDQLLERSIGSNTEMSPAANSMAERMKCLNPEASQNYHRASQNQQYVRGLKFPISTSSRYDTKRAPSVHNQETETRMKTGKARPLRALQQCRATQSKGLSRQTRLYHKPYTKGKKSQDEIESYEEESDDTSSWTSSQPSTGSSHTSVSGTYSSLSEKQAAETRLHPVDSESDSMESYSSSSDFSDPSFTENDKPVHYKNKVKTTGRLKRLKNKLGLIFHHHHHHHHHHHDDHPKGGHSASRWKYLQNIFHHKRKRDLHESQATNKLGKKELARFPRKHQGHLSALMKGFKSHLKHPNKSKRGRTRVTRLGSNRYGRSSKARKKLHWFRMLRGQRGVKLPNRGRVKLRLVSKKP